MIASVHFPHAFIAALLLAGSAAIAAPPTAAQRAAFQRLDTNGDSTLSFEELTAGRIQLAPTPTPAPVPAPSAPRDDDFHRVEPEPDEPKPAADPLTAGIERYFSIRKNFLSGTDEDATAPAKFSWTRPRGEDATYTFDLAVTFSDALEAHATRGFDLLGHSWETSLNAIFESHVSTVADSSQNVLQYQGILELHAKPQSDSRFLSGHHLYIRPMYETERHSDWKIARLDLDYTPDLQIFAWGQMKSLNTLRFGDLQPFRALSDGWKFYFRPFVGLEFRSVRDGLPDLLSEAKVPGLERSFGALRFALLAELQMLDHFALTAAWTHRTELYGQCGSHGYIELSAAMFLDERHHYTFGVTYKRGEDAPVFADLNVVEAWVGFEF